MHVTVIFGFFAWETYDIVLLSTDFGDGRVAAGERE
jgi:hypothetical protein